jgi:hypothetical protein
VKTDHLNEKTDRNNAIDYIHKYVHSLIISDLKREKKFLHDNPTILQTVKVVQSPSPMAIAPQLVKELT